MNAVFSGLNPHHIFELWVQLTGRNYFQFVREPDGSIVDRARPGEAQSKGMSLVFLGRRLIEIPVLEFLPGRPKGVNWNAWDWQKMESTGYTDVNLVVLIRTHDPETNKSRIWWAAGSLLPEDPTKEYLCRYDELAHFNDLLAPAESVLSFIRSIENPGF
jgi:hypothetical protein